MLEIKNFTKNYGKHRGVEDINYICKRGSVVCLIGPNGSGKSTLLKSIAGLLKANYGEITLNGYNVMERNSRDKIGYMPEEFNVMEQLTPRKLLYMISDYRHYGNFKSDIERAFLQLGLDKYAEVPFSNLSMGSKKKISMIASFLGKPSLVVLDEPTNGIDTLGIIYLKTYIDDVKKRGGIVVVSSHVLDFLNSISDTCLFLKEGKLVGEETDKKNLEDIYCFLYFKAKEVTI